MRKENKTGPLPSQSCMGTQKLDFRTLESFLLLAASMQESDVWAAAAKVWSMKWEARVVDRPSFDPPRGQMLPLHHVVSGHLQKRRLHPYSA